MKKLIVVICFLALNLAGRAQDTIFVKNGKAIPAIIIEKNKVEIKYKKPGQQESGAIYSVFVSDVLKIKYSDGLVADYTSEAGQSEAVRVRPVDLAGTMKAIRYSVGVSGEYFKRDPSDDLLDFWRYKINNLNAAISSNPVSIPVNLKVTFILGKSARNWLGDELQLILTPADAIFASANNGINEIKLKSFYYNIILFYGHTINDKKTVSAIIEPGVDLASMSGYIKLNDIKYDINANFGAGFHLAAGIDVMVTKRLLASARAGYRTLRIKESHKDESSSTGYSYFYVIPGVNQDQLSVKWNGPFATFGLSWCMYGRIKL
ncbi:MAG TPA: hypothetical protein P5348_04120 [Bacteroidales bacterium]|nr:hypothetical protein [Bacteroidales bacterium]